MSGFAAAPQLAEPERGSRKHGSPSVRFRPDIEGLRALAIGLVLLYHAGISVVPGGFVGVDVFFVISGFLITGMLLRELQREGRISLAGFYARRIRRLVPAATVVLIATALLVLVLGPPAQRRMFTGDIVASAVSVVNWRFAARSVDYQAEGIGASPVQHFWSLAVEEQFYVIWPLIVVLAAVVALKVRRDATRIAVGALSIVVVVSFAWSLVATADQPAQAFFVTTTRLWEMGIGALLAAAVPLLRRIPRSAAFVLGWLGLIMIIASALVFGSDVGWPGAWALIPTLGTAAVIAAGSSEHGGSPVLLTMRPSVWLGGLSYSLYLWHWPLLVAAGWQWGELGQKMGLVVVLASFLPAWLSYRLVENPLRRSSTLAGPPRLALSVGANMIALSVIVALAVGLVQSSSAAAPQPSDLDGRGAQTLEFDGVRVTGIDAELDVSAYFPAADVARDDLPQSYPDGCHVDQQSTELLGCVYGDVDSDTRVVLAGDSKVAQWADAFAIVGERHGFAVEIATKSACGFVHAPVLDGQGQPYTSCLEYGDALETALLADPPDYVVVSQGARAAFDEDGNESRDVMIDALVDRWSRLEAAGVDVIVLSNNPSPHDMPTGGGQVPDCVLEHPEALSECAFDRERGLSQSSEPTLQAAVERLPAVDTLDLNDAICGDQWCPPVIGEILVYRQGSHITNAYALSAVDVLEARVMEIIGQ